MPDFSIDRRTRSPPCAALRERVETVTTAVSAHVQHLWCVVKGWVPVTLYELAMEYNQTAAQVWARIKELEQAKKDETVPWRIKALDGRISKLRSLYRDTREITKYLENYYRKWEPRRRP